MKNDNKKKKHTNDYWHNLMIIGLIPYVFLFLIAINTFFEGSGLVGDTGGFESALFSIVMIFAFFWFIYVPATIMVILSIYKIHKNKKDNNIK